MKSGAFRILAQLIAALCIAYGTTLVYLAATGAANPFICSPAILVGQICVERFCVWLWLVLQVVVTIRLILCLWDCSANWSEDRQAGCRDRCWMVYTILTELNLLMVALLCTRLVP